MKGVIIRVAGRHELDRVRGLYQEWGYNGGAEPSETVLLAERNGAILGIVRCTVEHGVVMLRGMQVASTAQRLGIGRMLLDAFVQQLEDRECYCVPYAHLVAFYGRAGFNVCSVEYGPNFLRDRVSEYRAMGLDVTLMRWRAP